MGLVNATGLQLGDTVHEAAAPVDFPPIPRFRQRSSRPPARSTRAGPSSSRKGIEQLDEEGVVQVLRDLDHAESAPILAAVGALQFDVLSHRLAGEFGAPAEILSAGYQAIRRTDAESLSRLRDIGGIRVMRRSDGEIVALFENRYRLARLSRTSRSSPSSRWSRRGPRSLTHPEGVSLASTSEPILRTLIIDGLLAHAHPLRPGIGSGWPAGGHATG